MASVRRETWSIPVEEEVPQETDLHQDIVEHELERWASLHDGEFIQAVTKPRRGYAAGWTSVLFWDVVYIDRGTP